MATAMSSAPDAPILLPRPALDPLLLASTTARSQRTITDLYDVPLTVQRLLSPSKAEGEGGGEKKRRRRRRRFRFQRVALQFPDELLPDSVPIYWALKREVQRILEEEEEDRRVAKEQGERRDTQEQDERGDTKEQDERLMQPDFYILADTSYGNCCVDEVAAQHVEADVVVHYGHACLSPTARLPVIYVFPKQAVQVQEAATALAVSALQALQDIQQAATEERPQQQRNAILFSYDVAYAHVAEQVFHRLQVELQQATSSSSTQRLPALIITRLDTARNFEDRLRSPDASEAINGQENAPLSTLCHGVEGRCAYGVSGCTPAETNGDKKSRTSCCSSVPPLPPSQPSPDAETLAGADGSSRLYGLPSGCSLSDTLICYLGGESLALTNLLLRAGPATPVVSYDPSSPSRGAPRQDGRTNRLLMRRYAAVQKARDASVVGLLVGTLGVQSYLPLLAHLRNLLTGRRPGEAKSAAASKGLRKSARKVYTISVGKLSPAKLANFQEIDLFVLLACPENSLVDAVDPTGLRSKDFYRPIVTPFEMMLALDDRRAWTGDYVLDMERLMSGEGEANGMEPSVEDEAGGDDDKEEEEGDDQDDDRPHFSLVTGGYVRRRRFDTGNEEEEQGDDAASLAHTGAVVVRSSTGEVTRVLDSANAMHLARRSWKGLEQRLGLDEAAALEEGLEGIARGYRDACGAQKGEEAR